ncbi:MAG: hypothetical protein MR821_10210 [Clostridiales bacterium]|nr:hypothetical protein [Clostridiales bacterium]
MRTQPGPFPIFGSSAAHPEGGIITHAQRAEVRGIPAFIRGMAFTHWLRECP